ncbi:MAG TPA: secondary thiamine-phosphate synthase enzyme YjbQ [Gammaproteobacteria bacterium]|nr:secondary thiamine-phosphate synthase enzyme YjbQ [Gammaproteobacteria bacterium]
MHQEEITIRTAGRGTYDITRQVREFVDAAVTEVPPLSGLCHLFLQHTSASLILCENADPDVRRDLETFMSDIVPDGYPRFVHTMEGPDDMPAHVRSILTNAEITIPVRAGRLALGTWQGVYVWEHRRAAHTRKVVASMQT